MAKHAGISETTLGSGKDATSDLVVVANVVEKMVGRDLLLSEWQLLATRLETGISQEEAVKEMLETCATAAAEEFVEIDTCSLENLDEALAEDLGSLDVAPISLGGRALIVAPESARRSTLRQDLTGLGLDVDCADDAGNFMRPIPELTARTQSPDYFFVSEGCAEGMGHDLCQHLFASGSEEHCAIVIIDEGLGLMEEWDDWPLSGVLTSSAGPTEIHSMLVGILDR